MTTPDLDATESQEDGPPVLRWTCWPLRDRYPYSLGVPVAMILFATGMGLLAMSWAVVVVSLVAITLALASFFVPTIYVIRPEGFGRRLAGFPGGSRLLSWHVVRSYQIRTSGIVLFRRPDPQPVDALQSEFVPYGDQGDDVLCTVRYYLRHAEELPSR